MAHGYGNITISNSAKVVIQNYALNINENATIFNQFSGYSSSAHLVISGGSGVTFKDENSKIILDFDKDFEFGEKYLISKLATDTGGGAYSDLNVDFSHLMPKSDIYLLLQSGQYFIAKLVPQHSTIGILHKSNIRTMNNFYVMSNSMIYPRKYSKSQNLGRRISKNILSLRDLPTANRGNPPIDSALDSAFSLKAYESFAYQNESQNLQTRRIKRPNKRNYSRNLSNSQNLNADSANRVSERQNQRFSQNLNHIILF